MAGSVDAAETAGAGQSQPTEIHADQPQHQGHDGPGSPAACAETTGGAAQMRHTEDHPDQPQRQGHDGPGSPGAGADTTGGAGRASPPMTKLISPAAAAPRARARPLVIPIAPAVGATVKPRWDEQLAADITQAAQAAIKPVRIPFLFFIFSPRWILHPKPIGLELQAPSTTR